MNATPAGKRRRVFIASECTPGSARIGRAATRQAPENALVASGSMGPDDLVALRNGAVELVPDGGLEEKLKLGRPLRVKLGVDPSRPDLTLGHTVVLRKLRQFQDAGHTAVLIIGDFTARIGDPSGTLGHPPHADRGGGRGQRRDLPRAGRQGDRRRARRGAWQRRMERRHVDGRAVCGSASVATVAQMLEREDFRGRYQGGQPISVVEFLYPLVPGP